MSSQIQAFASQIGSIHAAVGELLREIPYLPIQQRKALLTLTRVQRRPVEGSLVRRRLEDDLAYVVHSHTPGIWRHPLLHYVRNLDWLESPFFSGLLSMFIRCLPFRDITDITEVLDSTVRKELSAATDPYHPVTFNWAPVLSRDPAARTFQIAPGYPNEPSIHGEIHAQLVRCVESLHMRTIYPRYSRKTVGRIAAQNATEAAEWFHLEEVPDEKEVSTLDVEYHYHNVGSWTAGPTEIRWAWKWNDLKPRVYYAQGPDQYRASRFIQTIFNSLVDSLAITHRFGRFDHQRLDLRAEDLLFIYDYSSFTSRLNEIRNFTTMLADLCEGIMVRIIDTYHGPRIVCLKELIDEFNDACNLYPLVDATRILPEDDLNEHVRYIQHTCGMLGVPGNISSCTLLHGIHLCIVLGSFEARVVGDDAIACGPISSVSEVHHLLANIGDIAEQKMESWGHEETEGEEIPETCWHYVKRPIDRLGPSILAVGKQVIFPPFNLFTRETDSFHRSDMSSDTDHKKKCANTLLSFARSLSSSLWSEEELYVANLYLWKCIKASKLDHEDRRMLRSPVAVPLVYPTRITNAGFYVDMEEVYWDTPVCLPRDANTHGHLVEHGYDQRVCQMTPALRLASDLGYAIKEPLRFTMLVRTDPEYFQKFLSKQIRPLYSFTIVNNPPDWLMDLVREESGSFDENDQDEDEYID